MHTVLLGGYMGDIADAYFVWLLKPKIYLREG